jgi:hypothetical protein
VIRFFDTAKALIHSRGERPCLVIKPQFDFQKTRMRRMNINCSKISLLEALKNLFMALRQLLAAV